MAAVNGGIPGFDDSYEEFFLLLGNVACLYEGFDLLAKRRSGG